MILLHAPKRQYFDDDPKWGEIPSVQSEIALIKMWIWGDRYCFEYEDAVWMKQENIRKTIAKDTGVKVALPLEEGVEDLVDYIANI